MEPTLWAPPREEESFPYVNEERRDQQQLLNTASFIIKKRKIRSGYNNEIRNLDRNI
jgi:hypothetical protein